MEGLLKFDETQEITTTSEEETSAERQPLILLYVFGGLLIGGLLRELNKKTKFPYTPMVVLTGIILGYWKSKLGIVGEATDVVGNINPHILLFVFIPVLIFESGFNSDWYVFKRQIVNILLLAGPGVLWGAILLGVTLKSILGYANDDLTWNGAFVMGSVMSATDPIAVLALLKEMGASVKFNTLIEGEALLNDGTAMVFYLLFMGFVKAAEGTGQSQTVISIVLGFLRTAGGGPLLGIIAGIFGCFWLRRVVRDDVLSSAITLITCYICFFCAEFTFLKVSGILAIVVLGLFMSAFGKTQIYTESEHAVHLVWSFTQYSCETLIFLLTGILIGDELIASENSTITYVDWIRLILFWALSHVMRAIMVFSFWPCLQKYGYPISKNEFYVLCYGGLRGALGITLALMVNRDSVLKDKRLKDLTLFYMSGFATLTLLINGTTARSIVLWLGIINPPKIKDKILTRTLKRLVIATSEKKKSLEANKYFQLANFQMVDEIVALSNIDEKINQYDQKEQNQSQNYHPPSKDIELQENQPLNVGRDTYYGINPDEICEESRFRVYRTLQQLFWEKYEEGYLGAEAVKMLDEACNVSLDNCLEPIKIWEFIYVNFTQFASIKLFFKVKDWPLIGNLARSYITRHLAFIYEVSTGFTICAHECIEIQKGSPLKKDELEKINQELQRQINLVEDYVTTLSKTFETIMPAIHTKRATFALLQCQKNFLTEYKNKGYLDDSDFTTLRKDMDRKIVVLENKNFEWKAKDFTSFVLEFPIFFTVDQELMKNLQFVSTEKGFPQGSQIIKKDENVEYVYIITAGSVIDEVSDDFSLRQGIGSILSYGNIVSPNLQAVSSVTSINEVITIRIPIKIIQKILQNDKNFLEKAEKGAMIYHVHNHSDTSSFLSQLTEEHLNELIDSSNFMKLTASESLKLEKGGYIILGEIQQKSDLGQDNFINKTIKYSSYTFVPPSTKEYTVNQDTKLFQFTVEYKPKNDKFIQDSGEQKIDQQYYNYLNQNQQQQKEMIEGEQKQ